MEILFKSHAHFRHLIILVAVLATLAMLIGWLGKKKWGGWSKGLALSYLIVVDLQLLLGGILWVVNKRWGGGDMVRSWEHPVTMVLAIAAVHVGFALSKRKEEDSDKFKCAAIFFVISVLLVGAGLFRIRGAIF